MRSRDQAATHNRDKLKIADGYRAGVPRATLDEDAPKAVLLPVAEAIRSRVGIAPNLAGKQHRE
jgi:hypothetical protein